MAQSSFQDKVALALTTLTDSLRPFVKMQMEAAFGDNWMQAARSSFKGELAAEELGSDINQWDAQALLTIMWDQWNAAFRRDLGLFERSLVAELRAFRNRWAHQRDFDFDDTYRLLDSVQRLLSRIPQANTGQVSVLKFELLRDEFSEAIMAAARQRENIVERWVVSAVYLICGTIFVYLIPVTFKAIMYQQIVWGLAISVGLGFAFLIYKRLKYVPVQLGPHECRRCRRIIYGTNCPYCRSPIQTFDSSDFRSSADDDSSDGSMVIHKP